MLRIERYFTQNSMYDGVEHGSVYNLFKWKNETVEVKDRKTGEVMFYQEDCEFPSYFSKSACNIIASKYFRQLVPNQKLNVNGVPDIIYGKEHSVKQVYNRLANFWVLSLIDSGLISKDDYKVLYDELVYTLICQMWAPNSPQWFNTGLYHSYGIEGMENILWYYDTKKKKSVKAKNAYEKVQSSACFITDLTDSMLEENGIMDNLVTDATLFKYGSGVGKNVSKVRAKGEPLSSGGKSSGLMSFLDVFNANAGAIKSGGSTRRAASLMTVDADHPEIFEYINWKAHQEGIVYDLEKLGYDSSMNGEAYQIVSGQNINTSVRITDEFMNWLKEDPTHVWNLIPRVWREGHTRGTTVGEVWDAICQSAWVCGDPGVQFHDTFNKYHTCKGGIDGDISNYDNQINATNPCSEFAFLNNSACNLASIRVTAFLDGKGGFDIEPYLKVIEYTQMILEASINWGSYPTAKIAENSHKFRPNGLGLCDLGDMFLQLGIEYGSLPSCVLTTKLCALLTGHSYYISSLMADSIGPFEAFSVNKEHMKEVLRAHVSNIDFLSGSADDGLDNICSSKLTNKIVEIWDVVVNANSFRHSQVTLMAPTGTISFAMDATTTGIEPIFGRHVIKEMVAGDTFNLENMSMYRFLNRVNLPEEDREEALEAMNKGRWKDNRWNIDFGPLKGANELTPLQHLAIVEAAQRCLSGAISKTVNLPNNATPKDISDIYKMAHSVGIKSITVYRDGCKASQPLTISGKSRQKPKTYNELEDEIIRQEQEIEHLKSIVDNYNRKGRSVPSGIQRANRHRANIQGMRVHVTTSFSENNGLNEVFISTGKQGSLPKGLCETLSQVISKALQYGVPPQVISSTLRNQDFEPHGLVRDHPYIKSTYSVADLLGRIIDMELGDYSGCNVRPDEVDNVKNEIPSVGIGVDDGRYEIKYDADSRVYHGRCSVCNSDKLIRNGSCLVCMDCKTTTGCS